MSDDVCSSLELYHVGDVFIGVKPHHSVILHPAGQLGLSCTFDSLGGERGCDKLTGGESCFIWCFFLLHQGHALVALYGIALQVLEGLLLSVGGPRCRLREGGGGDTEGVPSAKGP